MSLRFESYADTSSEIGSLLVFIHGYGADGHDLIGLSRPLGAVFPKTRFLSPHGPSPCLINPAGRQWFPVSWIDGSDAKEMEAGFFKSADLFESWLGAQIHDLGIPPSKVALFGFSQGTMIALQVALMRAEALGCVVGFSGRLVDPSIAKTALSKPPILLCHGDQDDVVPFASMGEAKKALSASDIEVTTHVMKGTAHGISQDGLEAAVKFLNPILGEG